MTDKQIIIDDQRKTIHRLQDECTEKTNAIIALGEQLKAKEQECEELREQLAEMILQSALLPKFFGLTADEITNMLNQLDQLKAENEELRQILWNVDFNRQSKGKKLIRIEELLKKCATGYTDEFIQEMFSILYELEPVCRYNKLEKYSKTLTEIEEIAKPYQRDIDKICGYCKKYDSCHACCIDDLKYYEYRTGTTKACERFVELERFNINIVANKILQKISECEGNDEQL